MGRFLALCLLALLGSGTASAFGLRTHLWIGQQIIDDLRLDCRIDLGDHSFDVPRETCESIRSHPQAFLAGALGPDVFPDLITGQVTTHPGIDNDWQTREWLQHLYGSASDGEELAFSAGYLVHAATDVFAHSYVNAYAGDVFVLFDEVAVERRHFVLEKYIDYRLPPGEPDAASLVAPSRYLSQRLILNADAARVSAKGGASHILAMNTVYTGVIELADALDQLEASAAGLIAGLVTKSVDLGLQIADGEAALRIAEAALKLEEDRLALQDRVLDEANRLLQDAINALDRNLNDITLADERARAANAAIDAARRTATDAQSAISNAERVLLDVENALLRVPQEICSAATRACNDCPWWFPGCAVTCTVVNGTCRANEEFTRLVRRKNELLADIQRFRDQIAKSAIDIAAETASLGVALQQKLELEAATGALRAARLAQENSHSVAKQANDAQRQITEAAREAAASLGRKIAELRQALFDTEQMKVYLTELIAKSDFLSAYAKNWRSGIDVAADEYIKVGLRVGKNMAAGNSGIFSEYAQWLSCYGGAFTPVPYQVGQWPCEAAAKFDQFEAEVDAFVIRTLPAPLSEGYAEFLSIKQRIKGEFKNSLNEAALELVKLAAPDATTRDFVDLLSNPENATSKKLDEVFAEVGHSNGKQLLQFPSMTAQINRDIGLSANRIDPERFAALRHALTLSKLALLDAQGVRQVIYLYGGDEDTPLNNHGPRYSILMEMLRSIDGNHQWQPYGLPYARASGDSEPVDASERHFGFGPLDLSASGMPLFKTERMRRRVFLKLFPTPMGGELAAHPRMDPSLYPFPECAAHPFPLAFNPDGTSANEDRTCAVIRNPDEPLSNFGDDWIRFWRAIASFLGMGPR